VAKYLRRGRRWVLWSLRSSLLVAIGSAYLLEMVKKGVVLRRERARAERGG